MSNFTRKRWTAEQRDTLKNILETNKRLRDNLDAENFWELMAVKYNAAYPGEPARTWRALHEEDRRIRGKRRRSSEERQRLEEAPEEADMETLQEAVGFLCEDLGAVRKALASLESRVNQADKKVRKGLGEQVQLLHQILDHLTSGADAPGRLDG